MTPKSRSYYDLESFWSNGVEVPLEGVLKPNVAEQQQQEVAVVEEVVSVCVRVCARVRICASYLASVAPIGQDTNNAFHTRACVCACFVVVVRPLTFLADVRVCVERC